MSYNNPFEKLNVKRDVDDDDDQGEFTKVKPKDKNVPVGLEQKKKKPRPVEKVEDAGEEGFTEVSKKVKKHRPENDEDEEAKGGEHKKRKGINYNTAEEKDYRLKDKPRRGRQFDKHSGTGRGKEIAKGGAGGKGTWGENPKNIARDFENDNDDFYFDQALHPEKKKDRPPRKPKKEDKKEGEEKEGEDKDKEDKKDGEEKKDEEPKKRRFEPKPLTEEEKLDRPKEAQTLEDYLKKQQKPKEEDEKKEVKRIQDGDPLKKREEQKVDILGTTGTGRKKGKKKKEKEINKEELDLNALIGAKLEISGANDRERRPRKKDWKKEKEQGNKFVFNEEDFPEL